MRDAAFQPTQAKEAGSQTKPSPVEHPQPVGTFTRQDLPAAGGDVSARDSLRKVATAEKPARRPLTPERRTDFIARMKQQCVTERGWDPNSPLTDILAQALVDTLFFADTTQTEGQTIIKGLSKSTLRNIFNESSKIKALRADDVVCLTQDSASFHSGNVNAGLEAIMPQLLISSDTERTAFLLGYAADQLRQYNSGNIFEPFNPSANKRLEGLKALLQNPQYTEIAKQYGGLLQRTCDVIKSSQNRNADSTFNGLAPKSRPPKHIM